MPVLNSSLGMFEIFEWNMSSKNNAIYAFIPSLIFNCTCMFHTFCLLLHSVELNQTLPENRMACSGEKLQYTCISSQRPIGWSFTSSTSFLFGDQDDDVNSNATIGDFFLLLTVQNETTSISTATNAMVTSNYTGQQVTCFGGGSASSVDIVVAGTVICNR